jgi:hyperosmotically inducible periplasmic protein
VVSAAEPIRAAPSEKEFIMTLHTSPTLSAALCAVAAAVSLAACDRPAQTPSAGQQLDAATSRMERKADEVKADARAAGTEARQAVAEASNAMADKVRDAAITTMINAELARDKQLSALSIDVDTVDGQVTLRGSAPDTNARDRATTLAQHVDGVRSVDNQLSIKAHS